MLPPYVYDLIAAVQKWEDEHGDTSMCFGHVLSTVPQQERDRAAAIAHYQRERIRMERSLEDETPSEPQDVIPHKFKRGDPVRLTDAPMFGIGLVTSLATPGADGQPVYGISFPGLDSRRSLTATQDQMEAAVEPQEFTVGDRTYRGFPVPPPSFSDDEEPRRSAPLPGVELHTIHTRDGSYAVPAPTEPLKAAFRRADEFNERHKLGPVEKYEINPADLDYFAAFDVNGPFGNYGATVPVTENAAVPVGWLRVFTDGNFRDSDLPRNPLRPVAADEASS